MSSKPTLVASHVPLWQHRYGFFTSFAETALSAVDDLRTNIYPLYREARDAFPRGTSLGFAFEEFEEGDQQICITYASHTTFYLYRTLSSRVWMGEEVPKLEERLHLQRELLSWAEKYRLSPRYWSRSGAWFLNQTVNALEDWFHRADESTPLSVVMSHNTLPAPVTFDFRLKSLSFEWNLHEESVADLKKRIKKEVNAEVDEVVDTVAAKAIPAYEEKGFTKPERRRELKRDMGWLIKFQCFQKTYEKLAETAPLKMDLDSVRKAVERRADDVALIPWTKV